jgi:hypothetical protein
MDINAFKETLTGNVPPNDLSVYLTALWYDAKGDWSKAHEMIQNSSHEHASWIHAYLHRKEGDIFNADYWYRKANKKRPSVSLEKEWEELAICLL